MKMAIDQTLRVAKNFRYPASYSVPVAIGPFILVIFFVGAAYLNIASGHPYWGVMFSLFGAAFAFFAPGLLLSVSTVRVSEAAISAHLCGACTQHYRWEEIVRIRKVKLEHEGAAGAEYIEIVRSEKFVDAPLRNALGIIRITDRVLDYADAKAMISGIANARGVEVCEVSEAVLRSEPSKNERRDLARHGVRTKKL